ncbi:queuine/archaeosine tRNA-ribosyltransferase [Candidatus Scalindua japonica]|uniref:Queuine/archaeosine tRNA-ribosyltransferase n=1 Tax=Candidatus Scalindua japonica TaxID=1284222 RepID=A0A286U0A0_9BACT|nr:queuine/archaeosine tRNA-ribosyltransferase [Candidatus Scalindua japonica]
MRNDWGYRLISSNIRKGAGDIASGGDEGDVKWTKICSFISINYPAYTTGGLGERRNGSVILESSAITRGRKGLYYETN